MPEQPLSPALERLLARMTLEEKAGQLTMLSADFVETGPRLSHDYLDALCRGRVGSLFNLWGREQVLELQRMALQETRLGIPLAFGFDVLHGHRTIFPIPLAEAGAFDPALWERLARRAAEEATADGLSLTFAPMLDVARDPRWGRMAESPGEDPFLAAAFAAAKVRGFQRPDRAAPDSLDATAKHFVGYGAVTAGREYASTDISERTLHEVHLPPFEAAVAAGAAAVMPSLTDLAGLPMTAHEGLLRDLLRRRLGFEGVVVSDYGAVAELVDHGVAADLAEAAALALKAGIDQDMMGGAYERGLPEALARGLVSEAEVDEAVRRVLRWKQGLGLFDDPFRGLAAAPAPRGLGLDRALAREAACRSMVLLRNDGELLPLADSVRRLAVIGPLAASGVELLGPWSAAGERTLAVSYLEGLRAALPGRELRHAPGCLLEGGDESGFAEAVALAREADLAVLCLGESSMLSGEAASRAEPGLPGLQRQLAEAVLASGTPVLLVLTCGRPLIATELIGRVPAVLAAWFPGHEGGSALGDLVTGRAEPGGRLAVSWPAALGQVPLFYGERPTGRWADKGSERYVTRYLDVANAPLFAFGHGLGYARFRCRALAAGPQRPGPQDTVEVEVELVNESARAGEETLLLFLHDPVASSARPLLELRGFRRVALAPGQTARVVFLLPPDAFLLPDRALRPAREPGRVEILVGPRAERAALLSTWVDLQGGDAS